MADAVASKRLAGDRRDYGGENVAPQNEERREHDGWTVNTLRETMRDELDSMRRDQETEARNLHELFQVQFAAMQTLLNERYETQTKAQVVAFAAAAEAVATALSSAKEATNKAEFNAGARFDQFRIESQGQIKVVADKLDAEVKRIGELTSTISAAGGRVVGVSETQTSARLDNGQLLAVLGFFVALVAVASQFWP